MAETSCIKLIQNSQELASLLHPYSTLINSSTKNRERERKRKTYPHHLQHLRTTNKLIERNKLKWRKEIHCCNFHLPGTEKKSGILDYWKYLLTLNWVGKYNDNHSPAPTQSVKHSFYIFYNYHVHVPMIHESRYFHVLD